MTVYVSSFNVRQDKERGDSGAKTKDPPILVYLSKQVFVAAFEPPKLTFVQANEDASLAMFNK